MTVNEVNSILGEIQSHFGTIIYTVLAPIMDKYLTSNSKGDILNEYMIYKDCRVQFTTKYFIKYVVWY